MYGDLQAKRATIHHSEVPLELLTNSTETPPPPVNRYLDIQVVDMDKTQKKPRVANLNNCHPKPKAALEGPLKEAENPTFTKIMKFCKKNAYGVVPKRSPICAPNWLFGHFFKREIHQETYHRKRFTGTTYLGSNGGLRERPQKNICRSVIVR